MRSPSAHDPHRDFDQEAKDALIDAPAEHLQWDCPYCHHANIDYFPLPSIEVLCIHCERYWDVDAGDRYPSMSNDTPMFPSLARAGTLYQVPAGTHLTPSGIMTIIQRIAARAGLVQGASALSTLRPHDLRRTYAKLCHEGGADLDQIKYSLGHASMVTTERYLGSIPDFRMGRAAGDRIRIKGKTKKESK